MGPGMGSAINFLVSVKRLWVLKKSLSRTPPRSPSCPEFWCGAAASPRDTAKAGNDRQPGEELHSASMVSYRAKGINKFTFVNLAVSRQQPDRKDFPLAASFSAGSPPATARLLCSSRSGVTCHPSTPRAQHGRVLILTPAAQCSKDMSARTAKKTPDSLTNSITFGAADGVTDRPAGQTRSKTATALAGKTAISMPAATMKTESAVNAGVGELGSAPLTAAAVWLTTCPVSTR